LAGALITIFVIAYAAIAPEHPIRLNKAASALVGAGLLWTTYATWSGDPALVDRQLNEAISSTAQIVFFLIGAMAIVEVIDAHNGFEVITSLIRTRKQAALMWLVGFVTFFLSAILDTLTTTIVMISLMRKLLDNRSDRLLFAAMIVIAANAGGAWSAIGDVTTTMLWIGGQITPVAIVKGVFLPSLINLVIPLAVLSYVLRAREVALPRAQDDELFRASILERNLIFYLGLAILILVPFIPGLRSLPRWVPIHRLIWRDYYRDQRMAASLAG